MTSGREPAVLFADARRYCGVVACLGALLAALSSAQAATRRVPLNFPTIHEALAASASGDSVLVAPGVWTATTTRSVTLPSGPVTYVAAGFVPHGVTLISESGPAATSIEVSDLGSNVRGLVTDPLAGNGTARVIGFTFRKPNATGAAIVAHGKSTSHLAVANCRFENVAGATEAGGIHATAGDLAVTFTVFETCSTSTQAGIVAHMDSLTATGLRRLDLANCEFLRCSGASVQTKRADLRMANCLIEECRAVLSGGGIQGTAARFEVDSCQFVDNFGLGSSVMRWQGPSTGWMRGCLIANNRTNLLHVGSTVYLSSCSADLRRNTFYANSARDGSAIRQDGTFGSVSVANSVFSLNSQSPALDRLGVGIAEACNVFWANGQGNANFTISSTSRNANPQLCDPDAGDFAVHGSSPCVPAYSLGCGDIGALGVGCEAHPVLLLSNPSGLSVRVDSVTVTTPYGFGGAPGEQHQVRAITPQNNGSTRDWAFSAWLDGSTDTTRTVAVPFSPIVLQANYIDEPKTTVVLRTSPLTSIPLRTDGGSPINAPRTKLWSRGTVHLIEAPTPYEPPTDGRWHFVSWSDGADRVHSYVVPTAGGTISRTANFVLEPYPLCTIESDPPGRVVRFQGTNRVTPYSVGIPAGSSNSVNLVSPQTGDFGGTTYNFVSWSDGGAKEHSFTMPSEPFVLTATFEAVVHDGLILQSNPTKFQVDLDGTPRTTPVFLPLPIGTNHDLLARSGQIRSNVRYKFASWEDTSTDSLRSFVQPTGHVSATATFQVDPFTRVTLQTIPPGLAVTADGVTAPSPATFTWPIGSGHTISVLDSVVVASSAYRFQSWSDGGGRQHGITAPITNLVLTATYITLHQLVMAADPIGTVLPGTAFVFGGQPLQIRAIAEPRYFFREWIGSGEGSYSGADNPATIVPGGPITEVGHFGLVSYDFALSLSAESPAVHSGSPLGFGPVYLWFVCGSGQTFTTLDARAIGTMDVFSFVPQPGILSFGGGAELRLFVDSGPDTTVLLGTFWVSDPGGGTLCLGPSGQTGLLEVTESSLHYVWPDDMRVRGVSTGSEPFCVSGRACGSPGGPIPVRISSFEAVEREGGVDVTWTTSFEARHEGFRVYRSSDADPSLGALHAGLLDGESPYLFRDTDILPDMRYWYSLGAFDYDGSETRYGPIPLTTRAGPVLKFGFSAVHPNPFVHRASLQFTLAKPGRAHVDAFDVAGRLVGRVLDGVYPAGDHTGTWDGRDGRGRRLAAGIYFLRLETEADSQTRRVVMLRAR